MSSQETKVSTPKLSDSIAKVIPKVNNILWHYKGNSDTITGQPTLNIDIDITHSDYRTIARLRDMIETLCLNIDNELKAYYINQAEKTEGERNEKNR